MRDLPGSFYRKRDRLADCIAACVIVEPLFLPTREELPRELISCEYLAELLALAVRYRKAEQLTVAAYRQIGKREVSRWLAGLVLNDSRSVFIWNREEYVRRYRELEETRVEYEKTYRRAFELWDSTRKFEIL